MSWSGELFRILGFEVNEISPSREAFFEKVHPEDRERAHERMTAALANRAPSYSFDCRILLPDGSVRIAEDRAEIIYDEAGHPIRVRGTIQDVTDRVNAEQEIRENEIRLRAVTESTSDGILTVDELDRIESANKAIEDIFRYLQDELIGRPVSLLMPTLRLRRGMAGNVPGGSAETPIGHGYREHEGRHNDGRPLQLETAFDEVSIGLTRLVVGSVRNIQERKGREAELQQAQKMEVVGQMTGGVAHDFNNILTSIIGYLDLLKDSRKGHDTDTRFIEAGLRASNRAADLTRQLLAFSRKQALKPKSLDLNELLSSTASLLQRTLGEDVKLEAVRAGGLWTAVVDENQLENSILNLALNARDAMPSGGKLTIETANVRLGSDYAESREDVKPGQYVMVAVSDTGLGMPPDIATQAFEPFFTTKGPGKGSGLGLSMVYGFVKQSGGHVSIYSEVGTGTTVKLYLPRSLSGEDEAQRRVSREPGFMPSGSERILVVEDDAEVREFLGLSLRTLGYEVVSFHDGPSTLSAAEHLEKVDLILTDVVLPGGITGRDLASRLGEVWPDVPVLFSSGYSENAIVHQGRLDPDVQLLEKPFRRETLAQKVRELLDRNREAPRLQAQIDPSLHLL